MSRLRVALAAGLMVTACADPNRTASALHVTVDFEPGVTSECVVVRVLVDGEPPRTTAAMPRRAQDVLDIAVFRDRLPATVTLEAEGSVDEGCATPAAPAERSEQVTATFTSGVTDVRLTVKRGASTDDGGTTFDGGAGDSGVPDGGEVDAGAPDAGDADAGAPDAGAVDAGAPDAGLPDAGVEDCDNRVDDDGDTLVDCADPGCAAGVTCDDGDACTSADVCASQVCTSQLRTCAGQLPVCMVPTGCDAGVCLTGPAPARQACDGGRCDGAGRCAPFCDPTRAGLRACYRFEGTLTDESASRNDATGPPGGFDAGVRGQGWFASSSGLTVGDHSSLDCVNALTLEAWVKLRAFPMMGNRFGIFDNDGQYSLYIGPGGEVRCSANGSVVVPAAVSLNTWHHVACVRGNGTFKAYVDGVEVGSAAATVDLTTGNANGLAIGQNSPMGDVLEGGLDGVRLWCEALAPLDLCATPGECG